MKSAYIDPRTRNIPSSVDEYSVAWLSEELLEAVGSRERRNDRMSARKRRSAERERGGYGEGPKRFMVTHIKESALIESLRGVCSSLLIWLNIPD